MASLGPGPCKCWHKELPSLRRAQVPLSLTRAPSGQVSPCARARKGQCQGLACSGAACAAGRQCVWAMSGGGGGRGRRCDSGSPATLDARSLGALGAQLQRAEAAGGQASPNWLRRFGRDGYLYVRGCLPQADVLAARAFLLQQLHAQAPAKLGACGTLQPGAASLGLLARCVARLHLAANPACTACVVLQAGAHRALRLQAGPGAARLCPARAGVPCASPAGG